MKMDAETTTETAVGFSQKFEAVRKFCTDALTLVVTDSASHRAAGEEIVAIREHEKTLDAEYKAHPVIIQAKRMQADKTDMAEFLESTRKTLKRRQMDYEDAEEKKRKVEEDRLAEIARKENEEIARLAKIDADRKAQQALEAAALAEEKGNTQAAEAYLHQAQASEEAGKAAVAEAAIVPAIILPKTAPKTANRRKVTRWRYKDPLTKAGIKADFLTPDETKIGGVVRSLGVAAASLVGGIEVYEEFV
jgi:membrane protein involved in colicin uptake